MPKFFFTFGQKYRFEPHAQGGHPDGWFTVEAPSEDDAREAMFKLCGAQWSGCYERIVKPEYYPRGELRRVVVYAKESPKEAEKGSHLEEQTPTIPPNTKNEQI